jgi:quercetin dioxygenase-like cupin family protein
MTTVLIILIIILLPVLYNILFPLKSPQLEGYFHPGQTFISKIEGVAQTIIKQVGDKVYSELTLAPGSAGPPEHVHIGFDESATITKGTLTVKLNNEVLELSAGSRVYFPKGQYHAFSNKTDSEVVITCEKDSDYVPVNFAYALAQLYPVMDSTSKFRMLHLFFKMSMFGESFDSYVVEAPVNVQKVILRILQPYARVLGYKLCDNKSKS